MTRYLRSISDHDMHYGELRADATVDTACGVSFVLIKLLRGRPGNPGPLQVCSSCVRAARGVRRAGPCPRWISVCTWWSRKATIPRRAC